MKQAKKRDILYPLRRFHGWIHQKRVDAADRKQLRPALLKKLEDNPDAVIFAMSPHYRNIGDHGIAYAGILLFKKAGIPYIELTLAETYRLQQLGLLDIMNGRTIILNGGGYLGTLWFSAERAFRDIILKNPDSTIVMLPNTIYYEDSPWGAKEFRKSIKIYNRHKHLFLYAREQNSYDIMKKAYHNVTLIPDIVLSLNPNPDVHLRKGCLLCLRNDLEKTLSNQQFQDVREQVKKIFGNDVVITDMIQSTDVDIRFRKEVVDAKLREFAGAELVITDRLHGMIFCAITGTPCIVLDSRSPKVRGCYAWIRHLPYIRFAEDASQISEIYHSIPKGKHTYDSSPLQHYFLDLQKNLSEMHHA